MIRRHGLVFASACVLLACDAGSAAQESPQTTASHQPTIDAEPQSIRAGVLAPKSRKVLTVEAGSISLQLKASACQQVTTGLVDCHRDVDLVVSTADGKIQQVLNPESVLVADEALIYRGAISETDKPDTHTFVLSDANADGLDDLMVWSGREGAYGGPSFDVFLFDPAKQRFVFSQSFSDLTVGNIGLFTIDNGIITTQSVSGCCKHIRETYAIESGTPKLIESVIEDSTQDGLKIESQSSYGPLCASDELTVFSCKIHGKKKSLSLCASSDVAKTKGYMYYVYGTPTRKELVFPDGKSPPGKYFKGTHLLFAGSTGGYAYSFVHSDTKYVVYTISGARHLERQGLMATSTGTGNTVTSLDCDPESVIEDDSDAILNLIRDLEPDKNLEKHGLPTFD